MTTDQNQWIHSLARDVSQAAGFEVNCTRDCEVLSDELRSFDGRFPTSVSTLRRFFGLIPKAGNFSKTTLNTLARYVGYPSFDSWFDARSTDPPNQFTDNLALDDGTYKSSQDKESVQSFSQAEAVQYIGRLIDRFENPRQFRMSSREFKRLKKVVLAIYERGTFEMGVWLRLKQHNHLLRFVVEQFPPLDYLASFGKEMVMEYLRIAETPSQRMFANGILAAGHFATDASWKSAIDHLPQMEQLNPSIHPLVQSRQLGIAILAQSEQVDGLHYDAKSLALQGLKDERNVWPRWANQSCYFAFNLADWAVLSQDKTLIQAVRENIDAYRISQDWHNRDVDLDAILTLRQVWNSISLNQPKDAMILIQELDWRSMATTESRTLSLWYHAARWILELDAPEVSEANFTHSASVTQYHGLADRILGLVEQFASDHV